MYIAFINFSIIQTLNNISEANRLKALKSLDILDTQPEKEYDELTSLAAYICNTPISFISLVDKDRQWFKSRFGLETNQTKRSDSFCSHAIETDSDIFEIHDASVHPLFKDNIHVLEKGIRFYAGAPLVFENGHALGTICVLDVVPRKLSEIQKKALKNLANQVV